MAPSTLANIFPRTRDQAVTIPQTSLHLSHAELPKLVEAFAGQLKSLGIGKGDVVSCCLTNGLEVVLTFLATGSVR